MLDRKSWLLAFLVQPGGPFPVDQIRVMKGMFLWSQEGPDDVRDLYDFQPYAYGPFDTSIYRDLESLETDGLIRSESSAGTSRRIYSPTPRGDRLTQELINELPVAQLEQLAGIKLLVTSLGFAGLLKHVYDKYPLYAARSIANV